MTKRLSMTDTLRTEDSSDMPVLWAAQERGIISNCSLTLLKYYRSLGAQLSNFENTMKTFFQKRLLIR